MSGTAKAANRAGEPPAPEIDRFRGQHLDLAERQIATEFGRANGTVDECESKLAWLARRRGRNGRALIEPHQLLAGEKLRAEFTCAQMMPRSRMELTNNDWDRSVSRIRFRNTAQAPRRPLVEVE